MDIVINTSNCMSRKNKKDGINEQCPNKRKKGDYCGVHYGKKVLRIDESMSSKRVSFKKARQIKNRVIKYMNSCIQSNYNNEINIILIQKIIRGFIARSIVKRIYGPAFKNPLLCKNDVDLATLETIWETNNTQKVINLNFPKKDFFSFIYDGNIIGYNIKSLQKMMEINKLCHPLSGKEYPIELNGIIAERIIYMNKKGLWENEKDILTPIQEENGYMIAICKSLEKQDIYIELEDLQEIRDQNNLLKIINECSMVWLDSTISTQRVSIENKVDIQFFRLPKTGPIVKTNIEILKEITTFLSLENIDKSDNKLISYVFLTAVSYVSPKINETYLQQ